MKFTKFSILEFFHHKLLASKFQGPITVKKRLAFFPSPAGMSLTQLFLSGNKEKCHMFFYMSILGECSKVSLNLPVIYVDEIKEKV
jgi:hypothetical protein